SRCSQAFALQPGLLLWHFGRGALAGLVVGSGAALAVVFVAETLVRARRLGDRLAGLVGEEKQEVDPIADDSRIFDRLDGGREGDGVLEDVTDRRPDGHLE